MTSISAFRASSADEPAIELDSLRNPLALNIDVLSGAHRGVSQRAESGTITIGRDPNCDLILFADPIEARHVAIAPKSSFGSSVVIRALDGSVVLDNGTTLEPGQYAEGQMPLDLSVAGTHVTISRTVNPHEFARPVMAVAVALALIIAGPNLVDTAFSSVTRTTAPAPVTAPADTTLLTASTPTAAETQAVVELFRDRVRNAGLGHLVEVSEGGDGTILASGEIGRENGREWRRVLRWFDGVPAAPGFVNAVRVGKAPVMPEIASVWLLGEPEITLASGEKLREGDSARGGWTVKVISEDGVILSRNGSDVTVTF